jgi:hypothetical protein
MRSSVGQPGRSRITSFLGLSMLLATLAGCAAPLPEKATASGPTVAVLINRTWTEQDPRGFTWEVRGDEAAEEEKFADCVRRAAASTGLPLDTITGTRFRALAFPDLDPRAAPRNLDSLRSLLADPRFRARVDASGVRYLAVLGGETHTSEMKGGIVCAYGFGAGACFGHLWWDHESNLSALILDMQGGTELSRGGLEATGTSWFSILGVFPVAAPSLHEATGCERFGDAVARVIGEMRRARDQDAPPDNGRTAR